QEEPVIATPMVPDAPPAVELAAEPCFVFRPNSRATRFVWKIDSEGRFNEVSHEFAQAVGPHAYDIIGSAFGDVAALFNLDPDGRLLGLIRATVDHAAVAIGLRMSG
ncbi:hypothetical protein ACCS72_37510, partial [Rhizobium ruizarguesonis]